MNYEITENGIFLEGDFSEFLLDNGELDLEFAYFKIVGSCDIEYTQEGICLHNLEDDFELIFLDGLRKEEKKLTYFDIFNLISRLIKELKKMKKIKTVTITESTDPYLNATGGDYDEWIEYFLSNEGVELFAYRSSCDADVCCATGRFADTFSVYCEGQNFSIDEQEIYRRYQDASPDYKRMDVSAGELSALLKAIRR